MALLRRRTPPTSRRALRRAHTRTLKAQAAAEKKFLEREERAAAKRATKAAKRATDDGPAEPPVTDGARAHAAINSQEKAPSRRQRKKAAKAASKGRVSSVRSYLGVARLLAPALAPVAYRAVSEIRGRLDSSRARKLGVGVEQLSSYTGHGAALSARIAGLDDSLDSLVRVRSEAGSANSRSATNGSATNGSATNGSATKTGGMDEAEQFRTETRSRLAELTTAVHAAERMPTPRRKAAHAAVGEDLDRIDADLLRRLGVR